MNTSRMSNLPSIAACWIFWSSSRSLADFLKPETPFSENSLTISSPDFLQSCGRLLSAWGCHPFRPVLWSKHGIMYKRVFSLHSHFLLARKRKNQSGYCSYQVFKVQFDFILSHAVKEYKDVRQQCVLPSAEWWSAIVSGWHPDSPYPQAHR